MLVIIITPSKIIIFYEWNVLKNTWVEILQICVHCERTLVNCKSDSLPYVHCPVRAGVGNNC